MLRKIILWALFIGFCFYVYFNRAEINHIAAAIRQGNLNWLGLAVLLQFVFYGLQTLIFKFSFEIVGIKRKISDLYPLVLGALFVNVLAPTAGNSGTILFADDAKKRQESPAAAVIGVLVALFSVYAAFLIILILGLINLQLIGSLGWAEIFASAVFLIPTLLPVALVLSSKYRPALLARFLNIFLKLRKFLTRFWKKWKPLGENWTRKVTQDLKTAADSIFQSKKTLAVSLLTAFLSHVFNILCLVAIFMAFDMKLMFGAIIAGYALGEVARVISPHPEGVGIVEVTMALIFIAFGVPPITATSISIIFRGINFWIPLAAGFIYLRRLKSFRAES